MPLDVPAPPPTARNPYLTDQVLAQVAGRAYFFFQLQLYDQYGADGYNGNENVIVGDGTDVLDQMTTVLSNSGFWTGQRPATAMMDVGSIFSDYRSVNTLDIAALKTQFIARYGSVTRPVEYPGDPLQIF